jgi:ketosteroid isomerase-like protein
MDNIAVVHRVYEAFESQDLEALLKLTHANCVVTQDPALPWGGEFVGHEGITNFAILLIGTISSTLTIGEIFEADGQVLQYGRTAGQVVATGKPFDLPEIHIWTINEGKVVKAHFSIDTPAMIAALT